MKLETSELQTLRIKFKSNSSFHNGRIVFIGLTTPQITVINSGQNIKKKNLFEGTEEQLH